MSWQKIKRANMKILSFIRSFLPVPKKNYEAPKIDKSNDLLSEEDKAFRSFLDFKALCRARGLTHN